MSIFSYFGEKKFCYFRKFFIAESSDLVL